MVNLDFGNPVGMEPQKNYNLFLKATQFDVVQETLNQCLQQHNYLKYRLDCQREEYDRYIQDKNELQQKYNDLLSLRDLKKRLEELKKEQFWVDVVEQELVLQEISKKIEELHEQELKLSQLIDTIEIQNELKENITKLEGAMAEHKNEAFQDARTAAERYKQKENHAAQEVEQCEQYIREKNEACESVNSRKLENENKVLQYKSQIAEIEAMESTSKHEFNMHNNTKAGLDEKKEEYDAKKRAIENQARSIKQNLDNAKHQIKDKLAAYGADVTNFIAAIETAYKNRQFSEMPRGPIGRYIEVPDERYKARIENHLGPLLKSFIVNNASDRKVMDNIVQRQFPNFQPSIITKKFVNRLYDVSKGAVNPPEGTTLMMNEIKCSDNVVMNTLIDYRNIETILLVTRREVAERITMDQENVPRHLSKAFLIQLHWSTIPAQIIEFIQLLLIQTDPQKYIKQLQIELKEKEAQVQRMVREQKEVLNQYPEVRQNIDRVRGILQQHNINKRELLGKINELENIEYPTSNEIEMLNKELQELILVRKRCQDQAIAKEAIMKEKKVSVKELETEFSTAKSQVNTFEKKINNYKRQIDDAKIKLNEVVTNVRYNENKMNSLKASLTEIEAKQSEENSRLEELKTVALGKTDGVRIDTTMKKADIKNIIDKCEKKVKQRSRGNEDINEIKELLDAKIASYQSTATIIGNMTKTLSNLQESRLSAIVQLQKSSVTLPSKFNTRYMQKRNYKGTLTVDHKGHLLTLSIVPRDKDVEGAVSSTKSLSGGERSYSTISFLLSLWSCVDHPFYFLDEYDVFTDQVNREMMTRLLIAEATSRPDRQYTFLTPQETNMTATDIIKIHKLAEPQR
uniref:Structural maintenance of chromosomes protein 6 n=1 Tax=Megaselia scalaris TaxID=36166 RepID=T1GI72_MEGSC